MWCLLSWLAVCLPVFGVGVGGGYRLFVVVVVDSVSFVCACVFVCVFGFWDATIWGVCKSYPTPGGRINMTGGFRYLV